MMHRMLALDDESQVFSPATRMEVQRQLGLFEAAEATYQQALSAGVEDGRCLLDQLLVLVQRRLQAPALVNFD